MASWQNQGKDAALETAEADDKERFDQIIELLLAAGYFRARIQGLSPFDKVIGGLAWCISASDVDVDADILFLENAQIGTKIKLGEAITKALVKMKCAYPLQSFQIQGLDYQNLFPVIQWLVKKVIETRAEQGDTTRQLSENRFHNGDYVLPSDAAAVEGREGSQQYIGEVHDRYRPQRQYRRRLSQDANDDEEERVRSVLLEYGGRVKVPPRQPKKKDDNESGGSTVSQLKQTVGGRTSRADSADAYEAAVQAEENAVESLMKQMDAIGDTEAIESVSGKNIGSIISQQSDAIRRMAEEHERQIAELERIGGTGEGKALRAEGHRRQIAALNRQLAGLQKKKQEIDEAYVDAKEAYETIMTENEKLEAYNDRCVTESEKLSARETPENAADIAKLTGLVMLNEKLKAQEAEFRSTCKAEMARWKELIAKVDGDDEDDEDLARMKEIEATFAQDSAKHTKLRALLAAKNRELAKLQRLIDDIPTRTELIQYERRFVELYAQVAGKTEETKKYYNTYNSLADQKTFYVKETSILNSIHDNFKAAMNSKSGREKLLQSMDDIVTGVNANIDKVQGRLKNAKDDVVKLTDVYSKLAEKQRAYYKAVSTFQEECFKNEFLLKKLRNAK